MKVPTANQIRKDAMGGLSGGLPAGVGSAFGSQILGRGIGTAAGGILGASVSGERDMAKVAVYQGTHEVLGQQAQATRTNTRGTM